MQFSFSLFLKHDPDNKSKRVDRSFFIEIFNGGGIKEIVRILYSEIKSSISSNIVFDTSSHQHAHVKHGYASAHIGTIQH